MDCNTVRAQSPRTWRGTRTPIRLGLILCAFCSVTDQTLAVVYGQGTRGLTKQAEAVRVPEGAVRIDGRLDEAIWQTVAPISDFLQREPNEGTVPTDRLEVRFAYDDSALYIGARMFSSARVQSSLGRRDDAEQVEYLQVELDTYLDRRTAYMFGVTAAGARLDHYHPTDDERNEDWDYDPVWQARVASSDTSWTAELWIPFSQLRFNAGNDQVWG